MQILTVINIGMGALVLASLGKNRWASPAITAISLAALFFLGLNQSVLRFWDMKYFADLPEQPARSGTVRCREGPSMDWANVPLRHTLATLAYRAEKVIRDFPADATERQFAPQTRARAVVLGSR